MPENNGLVTRAQYLKIVGVDESYQPKVNLNSQYGHLDGKNPVQVALMLEEEKKE